MEVKNDVNFTEKYLNEFRNKFEPTFLIGVIGNTYVGKTEVIKKLIGLNFSPEYEVTEFITHYASEITYLKYLRCKDINVDTEKYRIEFIEIPQNIMLAKEINEIFHNLQLYILIYDVSDKKSFNDLVDYIKRIKEINKEKRSPNFILIGNKNDYSKKFREVTFNEAQKFADEQLIDTRANEISCKNDTLDSESILKIIQDINLFISYNISYTTKLVLNEMNALKKGSEPVKRDILLIGSKNCKKDSLQKILKEKAVTRKNEDGIYINGLPITSTTGEIICEQNISIINVPGDPNDQKFNYVDFIDGILFIFDLTDNDFEVIKEYIDKYMKRKKNIIKPFIIITLNSDKVQDKNELKLRMNAVRNFSRSIIVKNIDINNKTKKNGENIIFSILFNLCEEIYFSKLKFNYLPENVNAGNQEENEIVKMIQLSSASLSEEKKKNENILKVYEEMGKKLSNIFNKCFICHSLMSIDINNDQNIISSKCKFCGKEVNYINLFNNEEKKYLYDNDVCCNKCYNTDIKRNNLLYCNKCNKCYCESCSKEDMKKENAVQGFPLLYAPYFMMDFTCYYHNKLACCNSLVNSKQLCKDCQNTNKSAYIDELSTNNLIEKTYENITQEKNYINALKEAFDNYIQEIQNKFNKIFEIKEKIIDIKLEMNNLLKNLPRNKIIIDNVSKFKFDYKSQKEIDNLLDKDNPIKNIKTIFSLLKYENDKENISLFKNVNDNYYLFKKSLQVNKEYIIDITIVNQSYLLVGKNNGLLYLFEIPVNQKEFKEVREINTGFKVLNSIFINPASEDIVYIAGPQCIKKLVFNKNCTNINNINLFVEKGKNFEHLLMLKNIRGYIVAVKEKIFLYHKSHENKDIRIDLSIKNIPLKIKEIKGLKVINNQCFNIQYSLLSEEKVEKILEVIITLEQEEGYSELTKIIDCNILPLNIQILIKLNKNLFLVVDNDSSDNTNSGLNNLMVYNMTTNKIVAKVLQQIGKPLFAYKVKSERDKLENKSISFFILDSMYELKQFIYNISNQKFIFLQDFNFTYTDSYCKNPSLIKAFEFNKTIYILFPNGKIFSVEKKLYLDSI